MKQQTFRKLKSAIGLLMLMLLTALLLTQHTSFKNLSTAKNKTFTEKSLNRNESNKKFGVDEDEIFALVNDERRKNNLNSLVWDNQLAEIARDYSKRMAAENFFDHFDPQGADVVVRAKKAKLKHWSKIGENLFSIEGMKDFDAFAVKNWMESPTHRQNILDKDFNTAGIGVVESGDGEIFITQVFIKR
jgi:uncharacterized protein YkwD